MYYECSVDDEQGMHLIQLRVLKGVSYSHFPAQIFTKSNRPTAQIPLSQCLPCSNLCPIPIFYCFFVDESQSQCMKSHFPSQKWANPSSHFTPSGPSQLCSQQRVFLCIRSFSSLHNPTVIENRAIVYTAAFCSCLYFYCYVVFHTSGLQLHVY